MTIGLLEVSLGKRRQITFFPLRDAGSNAGDPQYLVSGNLWQSRTERQRTCAQLPDGQSGQVVRGRIPQRQRDHVASLDSGCVQQTCDLIGSPRQVIAGHDLLGAIPRGKDDGRFVRLFGCQKCQARAEGLTDHS